MRNVSAANGAGLRTLAATLAFIAGTACSSSGDEGTSQDNPGGTGAPALQLLGMDTGFGPILPHRAELLDSTGMPTGTIEALRTMPQIQAAAAQGRLLLPPTSLLTSAIVPTGDPGNQFLVARFNRALDVTEALGLAGGGAVAVRRVHPSLQTAQPVAGRFFVGGWTSVNGAQERWVEYDEVANALVPLVPEAEGFPGIANGFPGALDLVQPSSIVFVPDTDGVLSTLETFPAGGTIRFELSPALVADGADPVPLPGDALDISVVGTTQVGVDGQSPALLRAPTGPALVTPEQNSTDVDPATEITLSFTESVQPRWFGDLAAPGIAPAVQIEQGSGITVTPFGYTARPASAFDLTRWTLTPVTAFSGAGFDGALVNGSLLRVAVRLPAAGYGDLAGPVGNLNDVPHETFFWPGQGSGIVNVPVLPEALLVGRSSPRAGLSVIDLNGFGQSTGNPIFTPGAPGKGETRWPFNPNVAFGLGSPGSSTVDGGSAGVFTLTLDSNLDSVHAAAPLLEDTSDMHLGAALDLAFNAAPPPFGCSSGSGNICALPSLKSLDLGGGTSSGVGYANLISVAPYPNPPRLDFQPLCSVPLIENEPLTPVDTPSANLLQEGDPFGLPSSGIPPTGLIGPGTQFLGPAQNASSADDCVPYGVRHQIGQFLYVVDRTRGEVVVLSSNRMRIIERIAVPGATSLAMGPNLDVLAVSSQAGNSVAIVDIDPVSAGFHQVLQTVSVSAGPNGLAFEPLGEDLLVACEFAGTVDVIQPGSWAVRQSVAAQIDGPFELAVTPRMEGFAFQRGVYYAYLLGRDGQVAVYESGPNGMDGWGYDSVVGVLPGVEFKAPKAIALDMGNLDASVYIAHEGPIDVATGNAGSLGDGAVSRLRIESALAGQIPLTPGTAPNFRDLNFDVPLSMAQSAGDLSGVPLDIAFDELRNDAEGEQPVSAFGSSSVAAVNGKANYRRLDGTGVVLPVSRPQFLFVSVPDAGVVDVLVLGLPGARRLDTCAHDEGTQSIPVPGVRSFGNYWRQ